MIRLFLVLSLVMVTALVQRAGAQTFPIHLVDSSSRCFGPKPQFTPSGDTIVVFDCANRMYLWPIGGAWTEVAVDSSWQDHQRMIFSPDGRHAYSTGLTGWLWDVNRWEELSYDPAPSEMYYMEYLSDGRTIVASSRLNVHIIDAETGLSTRTIGPRFIADAGLVLSADEQSVIVAAAVPGRLNRIRLSDGAGTPMTSITGEIWQLRISPDRRRLLVDRTLREGLTNSRQVVELDAETGEFLRLVDTAVQIGNQGSVDDIAYSPDGRYIAIAMSAVAPRIYDASTLQLLDSIEGPSAVFLRFSADGRRLVASGPFHMHVWEFGAAGGVADGRTDALAVAIEAINPNPAVRSAEVVFTLPRTESVDLEIVDAAGEVVWRSVQSVYAVGRNSVQLPIESIPSGTWRLILRTRHGVTSAPMTVVR